MLARPKRFELLTPRFVGPGIDLVEVCWITDGGCPVISWKASIGPILSKGYSDMFPASPYIEDPEQIAAVRIAPASEGTQGAVPLGGHQLEVTCNFCNEPSISA